jgi:hypothetical protein
MKENYIIERTCPNCGNTERICVSKRDAAFELVDINEVLGQRCKKCSEKTFSTTYEIPELDYELIKEWATNLDLHLMPQDEELLLANERYLENILQILDNVSIPDPKRNLLMEVLCVIVYDNSIDDNSSKNDDLKERVIGELNIRKEKLKQADVWINDYIKKVVYPQLEPNEK